MTEMKKMPFLIVKRTLFLMYFKFMHEFRNFHFMKIIKFTGILRHKNHGMRRMKKNYFFPPKPPADLGKHLFLSPCQSAG
jgi:hypothetical protein